MSARNGFVGAKINCFCEVDATKAERWFKPMRSGECRSLRSVEPGRSLWRKLQANQHVESKCCGNGPSKSKRQRCIVRQEYVLEYRQHFAHSSMSC